TRPEGPVFALLVVLLQDPAADPDSLLAARRLPDARRAAERLITQRPDDPHAHLALGRVWQAWPTVGRYHALAEFRTAERLAPDVTATLWGQDEAARFAAAGPGDARRFFLWFWGKRDPNLVTPWNERIAEHFRRLAYVRRHFHLLHPLSLYHRSATARGLAAAGLRSLQRQFVAVEPQLVPVASERLALAAGLGPEPRDAADQPGERSIYGLTGLDARGLVWLRHGAPDTRLTKARDPLRSLDLPGVSALDAEAWRYETASVAFTRATASAGLQLGGDYIFTPTTARQAADTRRLLETDRTRLGAPLSPRVWVAFFRGRTPGRTEVYYRSAPDTAGVALWDERGVAAALAAGPGLLRVSVPPGRYDFGLDVDSAGVLGRIRGAVTVPHFRRARGPMLSSLILGATDSSGDREAVLAAGPADLVYRAGASLAAYAEIYGLAADERGVARYLARYSFVPVRSWVARLLGTRHPVVFEFTRETPATDVTPERLVLDPRRMSPGRYRVTLGVTDVVRNVKAESVAVEITVR